MRKFFCLVVSALAVASCGGGGDDAPPPVPTGTVSGTTFDGLIKQGNVQVYDFSAGSKGKLLASGISDDEGLYSLSLQEISKPVWIEVTGGAYEEEADLKEVALGDGHRLAAVANYKMGSQLKISLTTPTYLAAGLAQYQIKQGKKVETAIDDANSRISKLVGVNIITTTPKQITDIANQSGVASPGLKYGFLAGAISKWTLANSPASNNRPRERPYNSIDFADLIFRDIVDDGLLDGIVVDENGEKVSITFGKTTLGPEVYRLGLGAAIVQMAMHTNNKTSLSGIDLMPYAESYVASTDPIFNNAPVLPISPGELKFANGVSTGRNAGGSTVSAGISFDAQSPFGIEKIELLLDGKPIAVMSNMEAEGEEKETVWQLGIFEGTGYPPDARAAKKGSGFTVSFAFPAHQYSKGRHEVQVRMTNGLSQQILSLPQGTTFY